MALLEFEHVTRRFRGVVALDAVSFSKRYDRSGNVKDVYNLYGMSAAFTFVDALKHAGKSPTRASLMRAATHLNERNNPFVLPGMTVRTTSTDHFPMDQARLERWHSGRWISFGGLLKARS